ncbi:hypothetical protein [Pseudoflavonifractor phocaeensis]|uniref:hypothetical protein n=1 Tax=Pseudoflavonifractor phocaeensis TaxID=1870988 RepID=UPI00210E3FE9|nr:hypothetical protein [Pseudoflavonifractor phocaeensis]MCQ4865151.1 hypothetical protein [Pseudoflavonifractor phocaeensis]
MRKISGTIMSGDTAVASIKARWVNTLCKERMPIYLARGGTLESVAAGSRLNCVFGRLFIP